MLLNSFYEASITDKKKKKKLRNIVSKAKQNPLLVINVNMKILNKM